MNIQPLGEQIIIRTIPQNSIGSILIPDSAKGITMMGEKGAIDAVHCVEAEVVAVGPGRRIQDRHLFFDMAYVLEQWKRGMRISEFEGLSDRTEKLLERVMSQDERLIPIVKPGDRILYHPAVQKFDRDITDVMQNGNEPDVKYFMIREESILAVIER